MFFPPVSLSNPCKADLSEINLLKLNSLTHQPTQQIWKQHEECLKTGHLLPCIDYLKKITKINFENIKLAQNISKLKMILQTQELYLEPSDLEHLLQWAIMDKHPSIIKILINNPRVNNLNDALFFACSANDYQTVKLLMQNKRLNLALNGEICLKEAVNYQYHNIANLLSEKVNKLI